METEHQPEQTIWAGKCSHWHFLGKWLFLLLFLALLVETFFIDPNDLGHAAWKVRGALAGVMLILWAWIAIERARRSYTVTSRRVIVEFGLVAKSSNEIRVQDIRSINVLRSGLTGLLGVGNVEFSSAATDDADVIFWRITGADKVRDLVRGLQG